MTNKQTQNNWQQSLSTWFESPLGRAFLVKEKKRLKCMVEHTFAMNVLRCGEPLGSSYEEAMVASDSVCHWIDIYEVPSMGVSSQGFTSYLYASLQDIPVGNEMVDVVIAQHCLEFSATPHDLLREFSRVLSAEGTLIITAFNPFSLWGLRKLFGFGQQAAPWCGHFISAHRIKDWLLLLGFDEITATSYGYWPPLNHASIVQAFSCLDRLENLNWLMMGGGMMITAKKRVYRSVAMPALSEAPAKELSGAWYTRNT